MVYLTVGFTFMYSVLGEVKRQNQCYVIEIGQGHTLKGLVHDF